MRLCRPQRPDRLFVGVLFDQDGGQTHNRPPGVKGCKKMNTKIYSTDDVPFMSPSLLQAIDRAVTNIGYIDAVLVVKHPNDGGNDTLFSILDDETEELITHMDTTAGDDFNEIVFFL